MAALSEEGIGATLIDLYSLPFDGEAIAKAAQTSGGRVVTVEDNYGAGFGSEVAEAVLEHGANCRVKQMYVKRIPKSGRSADDLMRYVGVVVGGYRGDGAGVGGVSNDFCRAVCYFSRLSRK